MKKKILVGAIGLICLIIVFYKVNDFLEPYKYANEVSNLTIPKNCKVILYSRSVGDFDGSLDMHIEFTIDSSELDNIENQCRKLNYKNPPIILSKEDLRYSGDPKYVFFLSKESKKGYDLVIFNKTKKTLLIEQKTIY